MSTASRPTDRFMVAEVVLTLILIGLAIYLYLRPAAEGLTSAEWWHWMLLGALFFGIVALHTWRGRRLSQHALHHAIREDAQRRQHEE